MTRVLHLAMFFFFSIWSSSAEVIHVTSQRDFDKLNETINISLKKGMRDIYIHFSKGTYYYNNSHIDLAGKDYPDANIHIIGNGSECVAKGRMYLSRQDYDEAFPFDHTFLDEKKHVVDTWTSFFLLDELVEVVSKERKLCRVKDLSGVKTVSSSGSYIQITSWYQSFVYRIEKIENGYIYFSADNLGKGYNEGWNVNNDYSYGKQYPRYRLCNVVLNEEPLSVDKGKMCFREVIGPIYECQSTRFLVLGYGTRLSSVEVADISFIGNVYDGELGLFSLLSPQGSVIIRDCSFTGMSSSRVISVGNKNKVSVLNCRFEDCAESCVISGQGTNNTIVQYCEFKRCGTALKNSFCVRCFGANYYIGHNTFEDYGYSAIGLGMGSGNVQRNEIYGVAEYNTLRYTDDYLANIEQHTLMDSGAIYVSTINDNAIIRYNVIDGYSGMSDNRGIFCDDGAKNLKIYRNVITNIKNSYCIDSRRVSTVEAQSGASNIGNVIYDNIIDGSLRFAGRESSNNGCEYGTNYILVPKDGLAPIVAVSNVTKTGKDVVLERKGATNGRTAVSRSSYKTIKKVLGREEVKKVFVRK